MSSHRLDALMVVGDHRLGDAGYSFQAPIDTLCLRRVLAALMS